MAISATVGFNTVIGNKRLVGATVTLDASYTTGGYAVTPGLFGLNSVEYAIPLGANVKYVKSTNKLMVFTSNPSHVHDVLITGGQALGDALQNLTGVVGKTAAGNVTASGGASNVQATITNLPTEVAATTNLSTISMEMLLIGT